MNAIDVSPADCPPWWKFGYVWLVIAGPAAVVLAAIATVWLALAFPETLVAQDYYRQGAEINKTLAAQRAKALAPAMQGRNHAATPPSDAPGQRP
jgi:hypothetical protein